MELIEAKLDKVTDAWNSYFYKLKFCKKRIHFDQEVATNYYGDIIHYFSDTFPLISNKNFSKSPKNRIQNVIVLLQSMYIQQDLIDEILNIFRLPKSNSTQKKVIRNLRNKLIGSPISRARNGKLKSSVLMRYDNPKEIITYVLYSSENNFKGVMHGDNLNVIINSHKEHLNYYFDVMLNRISIILMELKNKLPLNC